MAFKRDFVFSRLHYLSFLKELIGYSEEFVLIKGFVLEHYLGEKRRFSDLDIYCPYNFKKMISTLCLHCFKIKSSFVPLFLRHKVVLQRGDLHVEVHRRLTAFYSPFIFPHNLALSERFFIKKLNCYTFSVEFHFLYNLVHVLYNHIGEGSAIKQVPELLQLFFLCDRKKVFALAKNLSLLELLLYFYKRNNIDAKFFIGYCNKKKYDFYCAIIESEKNKWYRYVQLAPWRWKFFAFCDYLFKILFY